MKDDIDFLKWLCSKAQGFEYHDDNDNVSMRYGYDWISVNNENDCKVPTSDLDYAPLKFKNVYYPLLKTKAIEGINAEYAYVIEINHWVINIYKNHNNYEPLKQFDFEEDYKTIDDAKESALRYIYEQELK